ncbi:hypothetical protein QTP88_008890 [Uroleucon formosanum]
MTISLSALQYYSTDVLNFHYEHVFVLKKIFYFIFTVTSESSMYNFAGLLEPFVSYRINAVSYSCKSTCLKKKNKNLHVTFDCVDRYNYLNLTSRM